VSFDAGFELVMDGPHRKIVLQFLEGLLDFDELKVEGARPGRPPSSYRIRIDTS
jgi:hypothetical protein